MDPSLNRVVNGFTPQQRFFISFAQIWRCNSLDPTTKMLLTVDTHSPDKIRGVLPVYNHPDFWKCFHSYSTKKGMIQRDRNFIQIW
jgi:putative endopeptidase